MKHCPFCSELIQDAAVKCRYCSEWLDPNSRPAWATDYAELGRRVYEALGKTSDAPAADTSPPPSLGVSMPGWDADESGTAAAPAETTTIPDSRQTRPLGSLDPDGQGVAGEVQVEPGTPAADGGEEAAWPPPAWSANDEAPAAVPPPPPPPSPAATPDDPQVQTASGDSASLQEVAQRMERIKASAAVVRDALQEREAEPAPASVVVSEQQQTPPPEEVPLRESQDLLVTPSRPKTAADQYAKDFLGESSDFHDDSHVGAYSREMAGESLSMVAPQRAIPWTAVIIGAGAFVVIVLLIFRDALFPAQPTGPAVAQGQSADSVGVVERAISKKPPDRKPDPGEGQPVTPEDPPDEKLVIEEVKEAEADGGADGGADAKAEDGADTKTDVKEEAKTPEETPTNDGGAAAADGGGDERLAEARKLYKRQKLKKSREMLGEILSSSPNHSDALLLLAQVQLEEGQFDDSLETATRCIKVAPELADCWLTLGVLQQNRKEKDAAIEAYEKYLALVPTGSYARDVNTQLKRLKR